jgi:hypothetical protein
MDPKVENLTDVRAVLVGIGCEIQSFEENIMIVGFEGINIVILATDEEVSRLRFSANVAPLSELDEEVTDEALYRFLDLNTEIDPVSAAIDSSNPENLMIQARTTLRFGDLSKDEVIQDFMGLVSTLPSIAEIVKEEMPA